MRRAALLLMVVVCLGLLTVYLRESEGGSLHDVQSVSRQLVQPVQSVTARAVEPVRDAWDWTTGLASARADARRLAAENERLTAQLVAGQVRAEEVEALRKLAGVEVDSIEGYRPLPVRVTGRSPTAWDRRGQVPVGADDGVLLQSPVIAPDDDGAGALIGQVTSVGANSSVITFITEPRSRVGATLLESGSPLGLLSATASGELRLAGVSREAAVEVGEVVVTGGFDNIGLPPVYPPGIPIGQITAVGPIESDEYAALQVRPFADPKSARYVIVLAPDSEAARRRAEG